MKKTLLLSLTVLLTGFYSYSQTVETHTVDVSQNTTTEIETGDTVKYETNSVVNTLDLGLTDVGATLTIECTSAPDGNEAAYTQSTVLTANLITDILAALLGSNPVAGLIGFNDQVFTATGTYQFRFAQLSPADLLVYETPFAISVLPEGSLSIKNPENTPDFSVYYSSGALSVNNTNANDVTKMSIVDLTGAVKYTTNKAVENINVSSLANGVYILIVEGKGTRTTKKFVKY